jgi:hypothetical protein
VTSTETRPDDSSRGEAEKPLHELIGTTDGLVIRLVEGVKPRGEPTLDVSEELAGDERTRSEQTASDNKPNCPSGRHVHQDKEEPEIEK